MQVVVMNMPQVAAGIDRAIASYAEQVVRASMQATWDTAVDVEEEAKAGTPVETGKLVRSTQVGGPWRSMLSASSEVGYTAEYAAQVHEDMEGRHPKFLERAVLSVGPRLRQYVVKELQ